MYTGMNKIDCKLQNFSEFLVPNGNALDNIWSSIITPPPFSKKTSYTYTIKREDLILCVASLPSTINQSSCFCVLYVTLIVAFVIHSYDYSDWVILREKRQKRSPDMIPSWDWLLVIDNTSGLKHAQIQPIVW